MIYTVTLNPSLDYIVSVSDFKLGVTNRTVSEQMLPGGKGINVSTVLGNLGIENTALGFTAGFTGAELEKKVRQLGVNCDFIPVQDGCTRINVKLRDFDGTEINGRGPAVGEKEVQQLFRKLEQLNRGDILVLAGSVPEGMSHRAYADMMKHLRGSGVRFVVDASKELLMNALAERPFLIKPNNHELGEIFHVKLSTKEQVIPYARKLQEMGAGNVLVSMAKEGAVLLAEDESVYFMDAPRGTLVNAVGAGDSMVAGFLAGWEAQRDYMHAFKMGVAAGSASAFSSRLATQEEIYNLYHACQDLV